MKMQTEHAHLAFKQGGSDKVYHAHLEPHGEEWVVKVEYGPRGGTLVAATKTSGPVSFAQAKKAFDKLVREKTAKGYSPGEAGVPFQGSAEAGRVTGLQPQLLNPVDDVEPFLRDVAWCAQPKHDGHRVMVRKQGTSVEASNRRGLSIPLPQPVAELVASLDGDAVLDGELVDGAYHPFDLIMDGPLSKRLEHLAALWGQRPGLTPTAVTETQKRVMLLRIREAKGEGIVFKRLDAPYTPGRPNSGGSQVKHKLTQSASCIVLGATKGKRSVLLGLHDPAFPANPVPVGNVTIPPNHEVPDTGAIVEVRYLYAHRGGSLYQPVYLGPRTDIPSAECTVAQLKLKADASEGDDS